jgi:hypothetical protein
VNPIHGRSDHRILEDRKTGPKNQHLFCWIRNGNFGASPRLKESGRPTKYGAGRLRCDRRPTSQERHLEIARTYKLRFNLDSDCSLLRVGLTVNYHPEVTVEVVSLNMLYVATFPKFYRWRLWYCISLCANTDAFSTAQRYTAPASISHWQWHGSSAARDQQCTVKSRWNEKLFAGWRR